RSRARRRAACRKTAIHAAATREPAGRRTRPQRSSMPTWQTERSVGPAQRRGRAQALRAIRTSDGLQKTLDTDTDTERTRHGHTRRTRTRHTEHGHGHGFKDTGTDKRSDTRPRPAAGYRLSYEELASGAPKGPLHVRKCRGPRCEH